MTGSHTTVAYDHQIFAYERFGGVARYFTELACRIPQQAEINTRIFAPLHINEFLANCNAWKLGAIAQMNFRNGVFVRGAINRTVSSIVMQTLRPQIVHWTYFNPTKVPRGTLKVVTVYDMVHELFPADFSLSDPTSRNKRKAVSSADLVICISENTKIDLMRLCGVSPEKLAVTHLGYSDSFQRHSRRESVPPPDRPYLLYVGQRSGYKGFKDAVRAYASSRTLSEFFDFVVFGGPDFHPDELKLFKSLKLRDHSVRRILGDDEALAVAYRNARAFVYPSKYEGFGIPPLEAMACGCPVACSNTSSVPEVVGTAAILFDPDDQDQIRDALERVCFDDQLRNSLIVAGFIRAKQFSWDQCARQTSALYRSLLGK